MTPLDLVDFATDTIRPDADALTVTRASALDWISVGLAGAKEPVSDILRDCVLSEGGATVASVFGRGQKCPPRAAALINGTVSHALDYDDTHFDHIGHTSVGVFPATLAIAEQQGAAVAEWLDASLIGMESAIRIGVWLGRPHYQVGFHQTATAGAFGAAIGAGRLLGLTGDQMCHALGLVATRASGLKAQFGTMGKPLNAGLAASAGVEAAIWARAGMTSTTDAIDAFGDTHHGVGEARAFEGLGDAWRFVRVSHKFHACCHGLHAALEAAQGVSVANTAAVAVHTHPRWMSVCNQIAPTTGLGVKFSYRAAIAAQMLGHDTARLDTYSDTLANDPDLRAISETIDVMPDDSLSEMQCRLEITARDGERDTRFFDLDAPLPMSQRLERVNSKAQALIGDQAKRIRATLEQDGPIDLVSRHLIGDTG